MNKNGFLIIEKMVYIIAISFLGLAILTYLQINTRFLESFKNNVQQNVFLKFEQLITETIDEIVRSEKALEIGKTGMKLYAQDDIGQLNPITIDNRSLNSKVDIISYERLSYNCLRVNYGTSDDVRHRIYFIPRGVTENESIS